MKRQMQENCFQLKQGESYVRKGWSVLSLMGLEAVSHSWALSIMGIIADFAACSGLDQ